MVLGIESYELMIRLFTFETTHHALWAEEVAREREIPAEVVPAPAEAHARCNLAIETLPEDVERLATALGEEGVEFRVFSQGGLPQPGE